VRSDRPSRWCSARTPCPRQDFLSEVKEAVIAQALRRRVRTRPGRRSNSSVPTMISQVSNGSKNGSAWGRRGSSSGYSAGCTVKGLSAPQRDQVRAFRVVGVQGMQGNPDVFGRDEQTTLSSVSSTSNPWAGSSAMARCQSLSSRPRGAIGGGTRAIGRARWQCSSKQPLLLYRAGKLRLG